jgi:Na+/melibiose symporter-like transporter
VFFVNPIACALVLPAVFRLIEGERGRRRLANFDAVGAVLVTCGMLLLVYALVRAPIVGWSSARTIGELAGAGLLLVVFVINELRQRAPLAPLSIFRINGLGFSDVTQLVAFAGVLAVFFFLTLYMQNVLGYSPIQTGLAWLPLCFVIAVSSAVSSQLLSHLGTRPVMIVGAIIAAGGLFWLSRIPVDGSTSPTCFRARSSLRSAAAASSSPSRPRRTQECPPTRPGSRPRCSPPPRNSVARSDSPSSPRWPRAARTTCSRSARRCRTL